MDINCKDDALVVTLIITMGKETKEVRSINEVNQD